LLAGKFLPFKTPLSGSFIDMREDSQFSPGMLLDAVNGHGLTMGLVVDLTKTDRFYDKADLVSRGVGHYKLRCEGFGSAPTIQQTAEFCQMCAHFFQQHPDNIIGVHCTHGYNRTGFLIIAFLVEQDDWSVEAAISAFSKSRPPGIYKQHYLEELVSRYNGNMAEVSIPELPEWCLLEGQEVGEREGEEEAGGRDTGSRKRRRELQKENATFAVCMSEVSVVQGPVREEVQRRCQGILNWEGSGFPGSQPVSMDKKNLQLIRAKPYRVSWKADGTRYIMYIRGKGEVFLLDRDNSVFSCPVLTFPSRAETGHLADTVLDGELVEDKLPNGVRPRYLVYDIMQLSGRPDIVRCDHATRQRCIQEEIIAPRDIAVSLAYCTALALALPLSPQVQHGSIDKQAEPFSVRLKQFWDVRDTRWV
jgi:mRNA-capping enzyme